MCMGIVLRWNRLLKAWLAVGSAGCRSTDVHAITWTDGVL